MNAVSPFCPRIHKVLLVDLLTKDAIGCYMGTVTYRGMAVFIHTSYASVYCIPFYTEHHTHHSSECKWNTMDLILSFKGLLWLQHLVFTEMDNKML